MKTRASRAARRSKSRSPFEYIAGVFCPAFSISRAARSHFSFTTSHTALIDTLSIAKNSPSTSVPRRPTPIMPMRTTSRGSNFTPTIVCCFVRGRCVSADASPAIESPKPAPPAAFNRSRRDSVELPSSDFFDSFIGPPFEITVFRMIRSFLTRITRGVVATNQRPARVWTSIRIGSMKQVGMEKERRPWFHFAVHELEMLESFVHAIDVGAGLIAGLVMVDPAHQVRTCDHLQTAVLFGRRVDGNQAARHVREQTGVRIPVTIILMPLPRSADERFLQHHFMVIVIDLAAKELFHGFDDSQTTYERAVDVVFQSIG